MTENTTTQASTTPAADVEPTFQLGTRQRAKWAALTNEQRAVANASTAKTAAAAIAEAEAFTPADDDGETVLHYPKGSTGLPAKAEAPAKAKAPTKAQAGLLQALRKATTERPAPVGGTYRRTANSLVAAGWATDMGTGYVLTDAGKAEAKAAAKTAPKVTLAQVAPAPAKAPAKAKADGPKLHQSRGVAKGAVLEVGGVAHPGLDWQARMDAKGWNHFVTAEAMGVAPMTVGRVARAQGVPTASLTVKFAKALGVAPSTLWMAVAQFELAVAEAAEATATK